MYKVQRPAGNDSFVNRAILTLLSQHARVQLMMRGVTQGTRAYPSQPADLLLVADVAPVADDVRVVLGRDLGGGFVGRLREKVLQLALCAPLFRPRARLGRGWGGGELCRGLQQWLAIYGCFWRSLRHFCEA
jgi:hypothetical protein